MTTTTYTPRRRILEDLHMPGEGGPLVPYDPQRALQVPETPLARQERAELAQMAKINVVTPLRKQGFEVVAKGIVPKFDHNQLIDKKPYPSVLAPMEMDPLWQKTVRGEIDYPIPQEKLQKLERMLERGYNFPVLYVDHDIYPEKVSVVNRDTPIPIELVEPTERSQRAMAPMVPKTQAPPRDYSKVALTAWNVAKIAVPILGGLALVVVATPILLVGGALLLAGDLDPVVYGAASLSAKPRPGEPVYLVELARWGYEVKR